MSMPDNQTISLDEVLKHPAVSEITRVAAMVTELSFVVVHASGGKWGQKLVSGDSKPGLPSFCRLIRANPDGGNHCRLCHVLMAVAAGSGGPVKQRCHAGASVFVVPGSKASRDRLSVLSSCTFGDDQGWKAARARADELGVDVETLHKAYLELPHLTQKRESILKGFLEAIGKAIDLVIENKLIKDQHEGKDNRQTTEDLLNGFLRNTDWASKTKNKNMPDGKKDVPLLVHVVCELLEQRPDLPLTVREVAAAAHITPNHFTTLFHQSTGVTFTDFQVNIRIARAKRLLKDVTLNISDVARLVGFEDAGYFARRFRQCVGVSPTQWRKRS